MRIILEGVDGLGKTTIANKLIQQFGFGYYHPPIPQKIDYQDFYKKCGNDYLSSLLMTNCIIDRSFISEYAYNYDRDQKYLEFFDRILNEQYVLIMLVFDSNVSHNFLNYHIVKFDIKDQLMSGRKDRFRKVDQRYKDAFDVLKTQHKYKFEVLNIQSLDFIQEQIMKLVEKHLQSDNLTIINSKKMWEPI